MGYKGVRNVTVPTLTPVLPAKAKINGTAIIIAPGGGYVFLSMEDEGFKVARWFASRGITCFVLKYRLNPTPVDKTQFMKGMAATFSNPAHSSDYERFSDPDAVLDARAAVEMVRSRAKQWGLDAHKIGFIGFSAGALTAIKLVQTANNASMPDFVGSLYGSLESVAVPKNAPPLFGMMADDDPLFSGKGFGLIESWQHAGKPVEFHLYGEGGHGYGMGKPGLTSSRWPDDFYAWLKMRGLVSH